MKKFFCLAMFAALVLIAGTGWAGAAGKKPVAAMKAGQEVKTKAYSLTIPNGWMVPQVPKRQADNAETTVFATDSGNMAVTISVLDVPANGKDIAEQTSANMRKSGLKTTEPEEKDGLWQININGGGKKGVAIFGSNGKMCAVTIIFGANLKDADALLKEIQPVSPGLFPTQLP